MNQKVNMEEIHEKLRKFWGSQSEIARRCPQMAKSLVFQQLKGSKKVSSLVLEKALEVLVEKEEEEKNRLDNIQLHLNTLQSLKNGKS